MATLCDKCGAETGKYHSDRQLKVGDDEYDLCQFHINEIKNSVLVWLKKVPKPEPEDNSPLIGASEGTP